MSAHYTSPEEQAAHEARVRAAFAASDPSRDGEIPPPVVPITGAAAARTEAAGEEVEALSLIERAERELSALCKGDRRFTMSIPARADEDSDLVIGAALHAAKLALGAALRPATPAAPEVLSDAVSLAALESMAVETLHERAATYYTPAAPVGTGDDRAAVEMVDDLIEAVQQRTFDLANPNTPNATRNASERGMQDARSRLLASLRDAAALSAPRAPEADRAADAEGDVEAAIAGLDSLTEHLHESQYGELADAVRALRAQAERVAALEQEREKANERVQKWRRIAAQEQEARVDAENALHKAESDLLAARAAAERSEGEVGRLRLVLGEVVPDWNDRHGENYAGVCEVCFATGCATLFCADEHPGKNVCEECATPGPAGARAGEGEG